MRWRTVIRCICALICALAVHAALVTGAVRGGWFSSDDTTLPELDLTSIDLSFSETPDETATPVAQPPPSPAVEPPPPTPPPPVTEPSPPPPNVEFTPLPPIKPPAPPIIEHTSQLDPDSFLAEELPPDQTPPEEPQTPPKTIPDPPPQVQEAPPPQPQTFAATPMPAPSQARVAVDKSPPSPRRRIKPEYPKGARQRGEEGDVTLELDISATGTVDGVRIVESCGYPELEQAAIKAVKQARFTPARRGTANVAATAHLTLTFRLKD